MSRTTLDRAHSLADVALVLLLAAAAFALGCQELRAMDVWWHVRAGQWVMAHRQVLTLDPFSYASADRPWIDVQWLFQVILAAAHGAGGVPGIILLTAGMCAAISLVGSTARDCRWPSWVGAACWLPALALLSGRFPPRPEIFSLLGVAAYLAVLLRANDNPAWVWALPLIQVVWVNTHALFVLGPIILGLYVIDRVASVRPCGVVGPGKPADGPARGRRWLHIGGATVAVALACLANPYGLRGTLFPLELYPKISAWGGLYKSHIEEFRDLRTAIARWGVGEVGGNLYWQLTYFLLCELPLSFLVPAVCRAGLRSWPPGVARRARAQPFAWLGVFGLATVPIAISTLGLPARAVPGWLIELGRWAPVGLLVLGGLGAAVLVRSSPPAALRAAVGGSAVATWVVWLRAHLLGAEPGPASWCQVPGAGSAALAGATALLGVLAAALTLRAGGRLFRLLLAVVFGYLALQALRNANFFALTTGFVLAWNLGEWAAELSAGLPADRRWGAAGLAVRVVLAGLVGLLIYAVVSGRFYRATGEDRRFGVREAPLLYAHQAARFAGRPGLPDRSLTFGIRQANVYIFHNGPGRKPFMDGRLEVASQETFAAFLWLERHLARGGDEWVEPVRRLGDPLILIDHRENVGAEATLLTRSDWRCIYYDEIASVFVPCHRRDLEASYPSVDFAARHFRARDPEWQDECPVPPALAEASALSNLAGVLGHRPGPHGPLRLALRLLACDRLRQVLAAEPTVASRWAFLGDCYRDMIPDLPGVPLGPDEPWEPAERLLPAQAAFCDRRAWELDRAAADGTAPPVDPSADPVSAHDPRLGHESDVGTADIRPHPRRVASAASMLAEARARGIAVDWPTCDRVATALLDVGRPRDAIRIWEGAAEPPAPALRPARIAAAALVAQDFPAAERGYREALRLDPALGEAWFGLALLHTQRGEAPEALAACREGLRRPLNPAQTAWLREIEGLVGRFAPPSR